MVTQEQSYDIFNSPAIVETQKDSKESQKGLRTLNQIRECKDYEQFFPSYIDAKKKVFDHLDNYLRRSDELGKETKSRRVYDDDIRMLFQSKSRFEGLRKKMSTWKNIKAPLSVDKLPAHKELVRITRILLIRNKSSKERSAIYFNPALEGVKMPSNAEIFMVLLGHYVFDVLNRGELLFVYKNKVLELFKKELCHLTAIGYAEFVKETKEMFPDSFYLDGKAHYKCFDDNISKVEKVNAARRERESAKMKIVEDFFKMAISPNVISKYFKKTGGNKPKLREDLNKRLEKEGFKTVCEKTVNRWKTEILKKNCISVREILKADKSLYKEHTKVRKEFTNKRMTMKERVDIIHFVLKGKDPSEMDVIAYYSQHLPPWKQIHTWSIPIDDYYPS